MNHPQVAPTADTPTQASLLPFGVKGLGPQVSSGVTLTWNPKDTPQKGTVVWEGAPSLREGS